MSLNIFNKVCSRCMAQVPMSAAVCGCGYSFELDKADLSLTAEVVRTESEEHLYEAYLEARLQQMLDALRAVREECGPGKWTPEQLDKVRRALRAVESAKNDLAAQRQKAKQASAAVSERKTCKQPAAVPACAVLISKPVLASPTPPSAMSVVKVPEMPSIAGYAAVANEAFRAAQSARAQQLGPAPERMRHCPHCTAALPAEAMRCTCGHEVGAANGMPEFALPAEEYASPRPVDRSLPA